MKLSGFSFTHNCIQSGYPIIQAIEVVRDFVSEIVVVDMASTDQTRRVLTRLGCRVLDGRWATPVFCGDDVLRAAYDRHEECEGDVIIFFEADEVYDPNLLRRAVWEIEQGHHNLAMWRLQLEQGFQRCRWYPIRVHRIFPKGAGSYRNHPTICPVDIPTIPGEYGYMWDIANCFRDDVLTRRRNQNQVWGSSRRLYVSGHFTESVELSEAEEVARLAEEHWTWRATPFAIPEVLRPLVGVTRYSDSQACRVLLG
ncbi:MAG: glycosyltransferase [Nitrospiria bacterium]